MVIAAFQNPASTQTLRELVVRSDVIVSAFVLRVDTNECDPSRLTAELIVNEVLQGFAAAGDEHGDAERWLCHPGRYWVCAHWAITVASRLLRSG